MSITWSFYNAYTFCLKDTSMLRTEHICKKRKIIRPMFCGWEHCVLFAFKLNVYIWLVHITELGLFVLHVSICKFNTRYFIVYYQATRKYYFYIKMHMKILKSSLCIYCESWKVRSKVWNYYFQVIQGGESH